MKGVQSQGTRVIAAIELRPINRTHLSVVLRVSFRSILQVLCFSI